MVAALFFIQVEELELKIFDLKILYETHLEDFHISWTKNLVYTCSAFAQELFFVYEMVFFPTVGSISVVRILVS